MSRKTKCCKKYKRGGKYCRTCPLLLRHSQTDNADSRRMTDDFFASAAGSKSQRRNFGERLSGEFGTNAVSLLLR
jgi:hypothetical protein